VRQLCTQYIEGIYRPNYPVTFKSRLRVTQCHCKRNHWTDHTQHELFDVECYRDFEISVRGHSRSLKVVPFESLGTVSYSPSIVTMTISLAISKIFVVKEWPDLEIWVWGRSRSLKMPQFDRPCMTFCLSAIVTIALLVPLTSYLMLNNIVTLKSGLEVTQGHWNWCHSKACVLFPIRLL